MKKSILKSMYTGQMLALQRSLEALDSMNESIEDNVNYETLNLITQPMNVSAKHTTMKKFVLNKLGGIPVNASVNKGNMMIGNQYYAFKFSSNSKDKVHIKQIRQWQNINGYIICYTKATTNEHFCFKLSKAQMRGLLDVYGTYCHGTARANRHNRNVEYALTVSSDVLLPYRNQDMEERIFGTSR